MKHRRLRRTLVGGCVAAAPIVGPGLACDRSPSPKNENTPVAANANDTKPDDSIDNAGSSTSAAHPATTAKPDESTPKPSPNTASPSAAFVPPEVDLSDVPDFDREQILKIREMVIDAPGSADRVAELGMHYCVRGFKTAAAACFKRATEILPNVMRYHYLLAIAYEEGNEPAKAIEAYRAAIELDGNYVASYVNLGQLLIDVDVNEARGILEKAVELDPNDSLAHWGLGRCASLEKNEDQAMLHFKKALEVQPNFREAHHALSLIYRRRGNDAEAESQEELAKDGRKALVRNDPIRFDLSTRLRSEEDIAKEALENARKGKPEAAARFLLATMKKGYRGAPIHRALGEVLMMVGKYDEALVQFREALKIAPKSTTTKLLICTAQIEVGELDQAEITLNEIAEKKPKMHEVVNRLGVIDVKRGRLTEAEKRFRSALDMEPGNGIYRFSLAQCIALQGRDAEALEATDRTLEITPNDANVHLLRGRVLINMEHMQEAASSLQEALDLNPSLEQAYVLLAGVQRDENKHAESIRSLESGQKQLPDSLVIANDLAFSLAACPNESLRDPQRAISLARQICDATFQQDVNFLDTLATAYSAAREYAKAAEVITKAIERAETLNADPSVINALKSRRTEYEARLSGKS